MVVVDLLFALIVALVLSAIFTLILHRGPWTGFYPFFAIVFVAAWAGGLWLRPVGPPLWGVSLLTTILAGLLAALMLGAAAMPRPPRTRREAVRLTERQRATSRALGLIFWLILLILAGAIVAAYL
jgi:hypothetical protein